MLHNFQAESSTTANLSGTFVNTSNQLHYNNFTTAAADGNFYHYGLNRDATGSQLQLGVASANYNDNRSIGAETAEIQTIAAAGVSLANGYQPMSKSTSSSLANGLHSSFSTTMSISASQNDLLAPQGNLLQSQESVATNAILNIPTQPSVNNTVSIGYTIPSSKYLPFLARPTDKKVIDLCKKYQKSPISLLCEYGIRRNCTPTFELVEESGTPGNMM